MKKKKRLIWALIIIALCIIALIIWKIFQPKEYEPEIIEPEVYEDYVCDTDLLIGVWQSGTLFYRFNEDGSGVTWDVADDVNELEGGKFTWEVKKKRFIHYHKMEINDAIIPKSYNITKLDLMNLEYEDDFDVKSTFTKVE